MALARSRNVIGISYLSDSVNLTMTLFANERRFLVSTEIISNRFSLLEPDVLISEMRKMQWAGLGPGKEGHAITYRFGCRPNARNYLTSERR